MTDEQKKENESFPDFLTVAPPPQPYQQKATPEEIEEYNKLAKQYSRPENSIVVKLKDFKRLEYIYNKMTKKQKASAESFPHLPPPPPPSPVMEPKNPSEKLVNTRNMFSEKVKALGQARQNLYNGNIGNGSDVTKLEQSMITSYKEYSDLAEKELTKENSNPQQKATSEEIAEYKSIINKLKIYKEEKRVASLEDLNRIEILSNKMSRIQESNVEKVPVMPPSPMPPMPHLENPSKELSLAKKKFDKKSNAYYELVSTYFAGKNVDSKELWSLYDESMNLYNSFVKIYNKESELPKN